MKKIILLIAIVIAIPITIIEDVSNDYEYYNNEYPDLPKDEKWEYVKNRIAITHFKGIDNQYDFKYSGPVLFNLVNATKKDSLAFNQVLEKLKEVLPNKEITHFKNFTDYDFDIQKLQPWEEGVLDSIKGYYIRDIVNKTIQFKFEKNKDTLAIDNKSEFVTPNERDLSFNFGYTKNKGKAFYGLHGYHRPSVLFSFNEGADVEQRKRLILYSVIRLIGATAAKRFMKPKVINSRLSWGNDEKTQSEIESVNKHDWFYLKKLYSENLYQEFRSYIYKTYPWRYASNYFDTEKTKAIAIWVCVIFTCVLFILGFSLLYGRHYNNFEDLNLNYIFPILFILIGSYYVFSIYKYITISHEFQHLPDYIGFHIILFIVAILIALSLVFFDKYIIKSSMSFTVQIILKISFTFLIGILPAIFIHLAERLFNPQWFALNPLFLVVFGFALGRGILLYLDHFSENLIKQKDIELSNLKALKSQAEVKLLQSQINPHFLYNSLNSIASLAQTDADKTEKMALSLSDLFKYTINRKGKKNSTIGDEVEMVKNYLEVEQIRFGDRLNFNIEVDDNLKNIEIPMFLIQPLIENAVKHGISKIEDNGEIHLKINKTEKYVIISVLDNGPQFPDGLVSGHGLQTVHDLLRLSYGESASINIENTPEKVITITIKNSVKNA
ncbi:MAG: histidine kinase [Algibacter sp.]